MNVIILAAGFATRLYPLTETFPKALLKVNNKPILSYLVEDLTLLKGIDKAVLVSNSRYYPHFKQWLSSHSTPFPITILDNGSNSPEERRGAVGDIMIGLASLSSDDTLILASDTLLTTPIASFLEFAKNHQSPATILIDLKDPHLIRNRLGCAKVDSHSAIIEFTEKPSNPSSTLAAVPYYYYPKSTLPLLTQYYSAHPFTDAPGAFIPWLIKNISVYGYVIESGKYFDIGTKENWDYAKAYYKDAM